jgi:hypothetical protein
MLKRVEGDPIRGGLVYHRGDRSLDVEPHPEGGIASLLVNDTQIEIDEGGYLMYVWGYCPHDSWEQSKLIRPPASRGRVLFIGESVIPGVSIRLNQHRWPITFDESSGWICIGNSSLNGDSVEFSPGAEIVLANGVLQALWLHPEFREQ